MQNGDLFTDQSLYYCSSLVCLQSERLCTCVCFSVQPDVSISFLRQLISCLLQSSHLVTAVLKR